MNFGCVFGNHKWSDPKFRQQQCVKCNQIRTFECCHIWDEYSMEDVSLFGSPRGVRIIQKCKNCGDLKSYRD